MQINVLTKLCVLAKDAKCFSRSGFKGFTLAEVLITLGIIGVVAAMTIPTLIQNYNTRLWNTGAKVFERKLEEALKTMNTQMTLAGHATTENFVEELSKHFKTNKICEGDNLLDCFSEVVYWGADVTTAEEIDMTKIKTARDFGQDTWNTNIVGVQFANGTSSMIAYNPTSSCTQDPYSNQVTGTDCLAILYDTSGEKNPNSIGKDLRSNQNVVKLGSNCYIEVNGVCIIKPAQEVVPHLWNACKEDGTSDDADDLAFMQEYNISTCCSYSTCPTAGDSWAGAAQACGGSSHLPSKAQLRLIADYIYEPGSYSATRASEIGMPTSFSRLFVWARSTSGTYMADDYRFLTSYPQSEGSSRNHSSYDTWYSICVE